MYACVLAGLVGITAPVSAATTPEIDATQASLAAPRATPKDAFEALAPHRAIYKVMLGSAKNGGHVSDISGKMFFSLADDCHAWNINQKMQVHFYYSGGDVSDNVSDLISRENKDGSGYVFYSRRKNDNDAPEVLRGEANLTADANGIGLGKASYNGEGEKQISFTSNTLFPVHHTLELLKQARAGKKFYSIDVFDGADESGYNQISAFIGAQVNADTGKATAAKSDSKAGSGLLAQRGWPIRMAFFSPDNQRGSPDYEMDMLLLDNGVIKSMKVDYGDFSMAAELVKAEPLPEAKCPAPAQPPS
ncbi:MAG TPA: DUF1849 family protein [Alphaproteobacteria bacterium]|nr:DUF1849 family protein [Alphaproteobacteria bacterium]